MKKISEISKVNIDEDGVREKVVEFDRLKANLIEDIKYLKEDVEKKAKLDDRVWEAKQELINFIKNKFEITEEDIEKTN